MCSGSVLEISRSRQAEPYDSNRRSYLTRRLFGGHAAIAGRGLPRPVQEPALNAVKGPALHALLSRASPARSAAHGCCMAPAGPVWIIFENLDAGMTVGEVMEQFDVTREQVHAVLELAARSLDKPPVLTSWNAGSTAAHRKGCSLG